MRIRLAIFDMDGTILDTLTDLTHSVNFALTTNGMPERSMDEVRCFVGNGIRRLMERAVPEGTPEADTLRALNDFKAHYADHCAEATAPYPGIVEMLRELRANGILTAVVSNKAHFAVNTLIDRFFPDAFCAYVGEQDGLAKKPAPDMVHRITDELQIAPEDCIYIGDSETDVLTARNASLPCICVTWGFRSKAQLLNAGATRTVDTPEELMYALLTNEQTTKD